MAKVCANVSGLTKAMRRDGALDSPDDLREFTLGFTQGKASFDFIDVGHGKERADSKIKGWFYCSTSLHTPTIILSRHESLDGKGIWISFGI